MNRIDEIKRIKITLFLQWNDRNGCYTDENRKLENIAPLSYQDAVKFFFGVINEDFYYSKADNIFELSYDQVMNYAKENCFYEYTMNKLNLLLNEDLPNTSFYKSLL